MTPTTGEGSDAPAVELAELVAYLDELLESQRFEDYGPNGLQVDGRRRISRLAVGVSACRELFERAAEWRADAVLVHHGLFWDNLPRQLTGLAYERVAALIRADMSLIAYHLPLDAHPQLGNNILALRGLGLSDPQPFGFAKGSPIGLRGVCSEAIAVDDLAARCTELFGQTPQILGFSSSGTIQGVGIVTGGGQEFVYEAINDGLDALVTGEASEWVTNLAREAGLCYVVAGHHATERLGVRALGEHLAETFGVEATFIDVPNPV